MQGFFRVWYEVTSYFHSVYIWFYSAGLKFSWRNGRILPCQDLNLLSRINGLSCLLYLAFLLWTVLTYNLYISLRMDASFLISLWECWNFCALFYSQKFSVLAPSCTQRFDSNVALPIVFILSHFHWELLSPVLLNLGKDVSAGDSSGWGCLTDRPRTDHYPCLLKGAPSCHLLDQD